MASEDFKGCQVFSKGTCWKLRSGGEATGRWEGQRHIWKASCRRCGDVSTEGKLSTSARLLHGHRPHRPPSSDPAGRPRLRGPRSAPRRLHAQAQGLPAYPTPLLAMGSHGQVSRVLVLRCLSVCAGTVMSPSLGSEFSKLRWTRRGDAPGSQERQAGNGRDQECSG